MEKLVILDYEAQDIKCHVYNIDTSVNVDEDYILTLGFNPGYCFWYFGTSFELIEHKEALK